MRYSGDANERAAVYAAARRLTLDGRPGAGKDGTVLLGTSAGRALTAVKVFDEQPRYQRELDCYRRIESNGVSQVCGHSIPRVVDHDDALGVLEPTVVSRPYVLDFATVTLDTPPHFPPEVLRERQRHWAWVFGPERWTRVQVIIARFQRLGIYLLDPNPRNIAFDPSEDAAWEASRADTDDTESDSSSPGGGSLDDESV